MDVVEVKDISKEEVLMGQHDWSTFQTRFIHNHDLDFIFRFNLEEKYKFTNSIQLDPFKQGLRIANKREAKLVEKEIVRTLATRKFKTPAINLQMIESNGLLMTYTRMVKNGEISKII